jgi:putative effector of murein hydrolase
VREQKWRTKEVFVPLSHRPGHAQVDFGETLGVIGGVKCKIHFLLGPATVALALPLWDNRDTIRTSVAPIVLALLTGSIVAAGSAIMLARAFGLPMEVLLSLAPKSTTAPVALGISE